MAPVVYYSSLSCVCQSVLAVIKAIGLEDVDLKTLNLAAGEHLTPEYLKLNPRHSVPFLVDGDVKIWESHAIIPYLMDKYATNDDLYPRDLALRARVNALLHFDNAILYTRARNMSEPLWQGKSKTVSEENSKKAEEAYKELDTLIGDGPWLLGDRLTIADICCLTNIKAIEVFIGDTTHYTNLTRWLKLGSEKIVGYNEVIVPGCKMYAGAIRSIMNS